MNKTIIFCVLISNNRKIHQPVSLIRNFVPVVALSAFDVQSILSNDISVFVTASLCSMNLIVDFFSVWFPSRDFIYVHFVFSFKFNSFFINFSFGLPFFFWLSVYTFHGTYTHIHNGFPCFLLLKCFVSIVTRLDFSLMLELLFLHSDLYKGHNITATKKKN